MRWLGLATGIFSVISLAAMGVMSEHKADRWRDLAIDAIETTKTCSEALSSCRDLRKADLDECAEQLNERSKHTNELAEAFCRERVTGCGHFVSLMKRGNGIYDCRCQP